VSSKHCLFPQNQRNGTKKGFDCLNFETIAMKKSLYTLFIGITLTVSTQAQIKLIGVTYNTGTESVDLVQWAVFDSTSVTTTPTALDAYLFASSSFDSFISNYYISGVTGEDTGLYSYNTDTGESDLNTGLSFSNIAEFDMSNSKMYNLIMETEEYISVYEYDIASNQDSLIGTIYEPGVNGIVVDAIGFDSNNGIIYYVGFTNDPGLALYAIPVREETFSFTKTILNTPNVNGNITGLHFDNVNEKLFAMNDVYDENFYFTGRDIVEIDITTGDVTTLTELSEFLYFLGGSSLFDQNSGTFLLVGITNTNMVEMIAFDTYTNTYVTGFVPDNVSEIVCDNTLFARTRYLVAGTEQQQTLSFNLYPNPVSDMLNLEFAANGPVQVQIFTSTGELVYEKNGSLISRMNLDMSTFAPGLYSVNVIGPQEAVTKKVLVN